MDDPKSPPRDATAASPRPKRASKPATVEIATTSVGPFPSPKVDPSTRKLSMPGMRRRRYRTGKVLGRGGMGEVHAARDRRIGRSVAVKVMLEESAARPDAQRRFLREARVQGQLEHPAIVPVYDLGWDRSGRAYFAMKRVSGVTLGDVIRALRDRNPEYEAKYSLRRLLSIFQQVCLAIEYVHARGVVHRDVKPNNLMLGDFGEVYILDWGIAKVLGSQEPESSTLRLSRWDHAEGTGQGEVLGTLGYMAPEQITSASTVDARADVYSLGAVLFQLLTLEPLHGYGNAPERARSTQEGADARASRRAPDRDIPPELDAICEKATALAPDDRYPSARAFHDAIEAFLEGDRDTRLRAEIAEHHVENARHAVTVMMTNGLDAPDQRKRALREAGRALALDPKNEAAAGIVARLMLETPKEMPGEVRAATDAILRSEMRRGVRLSSAALIAVTATGVLLPMTGAVRSFAGVAAIVASMLVTAAYGLYSSRSDAQHFRHHTVLLAIPLCFAIAGFSGVLGPLLLSPAIALAFGALVSVSHWLGRQRLAILTLTCASWAVPAILEWAGWLPQAYRFEDGALTILPHLTDFPEIYVRAGLFGVNFALFVAVSALLWRYSAWIAESRERLHLHAWHLENIAPGEHRERASRPPAPPEPPDVTRSRTRAQIGHQQR